MNIVSRFKRPANRKITEFFPQPITEHFSHAEIQQRIAEERLRQARYSFNLAWGLTAGIAIVSLFGMAISIQSQNGIVAAPATAGLAVSIRYLQLVKDSNDRLDRLKVVKNGQNSPD